MTQRTQAILLLCCAFLGVILLLSSPTRAADRTPLLCPNGQTTFVEGQAPAGEALLLYLGGRAVGGGLSDASGTYRLPLRVQERPGAYPVEVRLRSTRAVVERFTCLVDIPLDSTTVLTPTPAPPSAPISPTAQRSAPPGLPTVGSGPTAASSPTAGAPARTATQAVTATLTPTGPTATPTVTPTGPTATPTNTPSPTRTLAPGQPTSTVTTTPPRTSALVIVDVVLLDPAYPQDSEEYVQIRNDGRQAVNIQGWRVVNASRPDGARAAVPAFVFPAYNVGPDETIALFSQAGENDLEIGDFFWAQGQEVWKAGDRAELRDAQNNLIQAFTVPPFE